MKYSQKTIIFILASTLIFFGIDISCAFAQSNISAFESVKTFNLKLSPSCTQVTSEYCRTSASPLIENGLIYARAFDEFIYVINQATGEVTKKYNTEDLSFFEPIIRDDILYASSWYMFAFDQQTTHQKWKTGWAITSTPVVYNGSIIFGARDGISALDRWTGKEKWHLKYDNESFSSPLIHNDHILVGSYSNSIKGKSGFYSINAETGKEEWVIRAGYNYYAKPCAITNTIYVGTEDNYFSAVNEETGRYKWSFSSKDSVLTHFTTTPYCDVNRIYIGSSGSNTASILYAFDSETGKIAWTFKPPSPSNEDISISHEFMSSPNVHDNVIFIGNDDHYLYAIHKETGKLKWKFAADAEIRSRPTINNGVVYFTTLAGSLYAVDERTGRIHSN